MSDGAGQSLEAGLLIDRSRRSPNHGPRAGGRAPDMLLLHYTGMQTAEAAIERLCDPAAQVSAHYVVLEDGGILGLVDEDRRAHHAGVSSWRGETDVNSLSIGVEIVNPGHEFGYRPFPPPQIAAVTALARAIIGRWRIPAARVLAHSDVAPRRKQDPGELFPWQSLAAAGVGVWPGTVAEAVDDGFVPLALGVAGPPVRALQAMLADYGYGIALSGVYDEETAAVVTALQRHFRPSRVDGTCDRATLEVLMRLMQAGRSTG